jgi:biotin synthase
LKVSNILSKKELTQEDLEILLSASSDHDIAAIFNAAEAIREEKVGKKIYLRGLIEYSNHCEKNCYYCGIRAGNKEVYRYRMQENEVIGCAETALKNNYGSVVIQSGEETGRDFVNAIDRFVQEIKKLSNRKLGITLSCGEQSAETYKRWFESGAHRYLLRIETSDPVLYSRIHPQNQKHDFSARIEALMRLKNAGYQLGSGIMIGLPGQTISQLAADLLFLKQLDVDMVGMGPYIEHEETPLFAQKDQLLAKEERLELALRMIAVLRLLMPDINMASSTALDSLSPLGRLRAIKAGANILMPNLTPVKYRENYFLYNDKPYLTEAGDLIKRIQESELLKNYQIRFNEWGDSLHFKNRV